ncbi:MAG: ATP-binding cassette domain-containing protein, partial [Clostridiales bacterium]|nr:ATP-binding cassette domain-containing protein [Clostridiales bacterium]
MLELKNISKTYKSQKGNECRAVDGISIDFGESGLIFVCGKSGSGKSTLLNLMSGMDGVDGGEIVIAGKSSKDFKQSDFDVYRNTYVGFIFQDFSIIEELSIRENIEMSLKLQNKEVKSENIETALKQVDLDGYGERRSFELSGGQRQRVSIARALIKNPKIIFADEPTGSLDTNTGRQIFELFKELSQDRLIIVVSHDIDSALIYGDRIIELADGRVVSDKTKVSDVDLRRFKAEYQSKVDESFVETKARETQNKEIFERIDTKLPTRHAVKISAANFKQKKIQFIITMLLTICSLTVFALSYVMKSYNYHDASLNTFQKLNVNTLLAVNQKEVLDENGEVTNQAIEFDYETVGSVVSDTGRAYPAFRQTVPIEQYAPLGKEEKYKTKINLFVELGESIDAKNLGSFYHAELIIGSFPRANQNAVEIMISDYLADGIMYYGAVFDGNYTVYPNTGYGYILNSVIAYNGIELKIVGIFKTDYREMDFETRNNFRAEFNLANIYSAALTTTDALFNAAKKSYALPVSACLYETGKEDDYIKQTLYLTSAGSVAELLGASMFFVNVKYADGHNANTSLIDNEIVISYSVLNDILGSYDDFDDIEESFLSGLSLGITLFDIERNPVAQNVKIAAVFDDTSMPDLKYAAAVTPAMKEIYTRDSLIVANLFIPLDGKKSADAKLLSYLEERNIEYTTYATGELKMMDTLFKMLTQILDGVSLIMFLFVLILLYNFIASSINSKKKEIGILRAIGARGKDIAK